MTGLNSLQAWNWWEMIVIHRDRILLAFRRSLPQEAMAEVAALRELTALEVNDIWPSEELDEPVA
jgi:hypothetical protein